MKVSSFTRFINEAGIYKGGLTNPSIPIKALERAKNTVAYKVLNFIFEAGSEGVRFTDIGRYIVEDIKGGKYDPIRHRGYYSTNLYGTWATPGLFNLYCKKLKNGRWALNDETKEFFRVENELYGKLSKGSLDFLARALRRKK